MSLIDFNPICSDDSIIVLWSIISFIFQIAIGNEINFVEKNTQQPFPGDVVTTDAARRQFTIRDYSRNVRGEYYWSLPTQFLGNKVRAIHMEEWISFVCLLSASFSSKCVEWLNPCHVESVWEDVEIYLNIASFLDAEMAQVVEIHSQEGQEYPHC